MRLWSKNFIIACMANFSMFFAFYMLLPLMAIYLEEVLLADKTQAGIIISSYVITSLMVRPFAGYLVDTLPRKRLLLICLFVYMLCFMGYIVGATLLFILLVRILHGGSFGISTVSLNTFALDIMPSKRRGEGIGYFGVMSNIAMATGPMVSMMIFESTHSFQTIFRLSLLMAVVSLVLINFIRAGETIKVSPGEKEPISLDRFILIKGLRGAFSMLLISFSYGMISTYIALYGKDVVGITSGSGIFFIFFAVGIILARLFSGRLVNRGIFRPVIISGLLLLIVTYIVFISFHDIIIFYSSAICLGAGYGVLAPAFQTMFINLAPHNKRGTANATYFASWDAGIGLGVLFGGIISDYFSLTAAFWIGTALLILGALQYLFVVAPYFEKNRLQ